MDGQACVPISLGQGLCILFSVRKRKGARSCPIGRIRLVDVRCLQLLDRLNAAERIPSKKKIWGVTSLAASTIQSHLWSSQTHEECQQRTICHRQSGRHRLPHRAIDSLKLSRQVQPIFSVSRSSKTQQYARCAIIKIPSFNTEITTAV